MQMEPPFHINAADPMPLYAQLARAIRFAIATQQLRTGDQLPTVRQLAVDLKINANTVARVYAELERAGMVETRRGVGTFVLAHDHHTVNKRSLESERHFQALVDRCVTDAAALGFSIDELIDHLASKLRKET
jgi:GntR family transcriptional regulator